MPAVVDHDSGLRQSPKQKIWQRLDGSTMHLEHAGLGVTQITLAARSRAEFEATRPKNPAWSPAHSSATRSNSAFGHRSLLVDLLAVLLDFSTQAQATRLQDGMLAG